MIRSALDYERALRFCAYVGARLEVPSKLHADLVRQTGGGDADVALRAWYADVDAEIEASGEPITPDVFRWLSTRWRTWSATRAEAAAAAAFLAGGKS